MNSSFHLQFESKFKLIGCPIDEDFSKNSMFISHADEIDIQVKRLYACSDRSVWSTTWSSICLDINKHNVWINEVWQYQHGNCITSVKLLQLQLHCNNFRNVLKKPWYSFVKPCSNELLLPNAIHIEIISIKRESNCFSG